MKHFFDSTNVGSRMYGMNSQLEEVDELSIVLKQLKLQDYRENFVKEKVIYKDLPVLTEEILKELIPDKVPRLRLKDFIKKNFLKKKGEGWEIDSGLVKKMVKEQQVGKGAFGNITIGEIDVGSGSMTVALKKIKLDGDRSTREKVENEAKVMSLCHHPNVLKCFGCFFSDDEKCATLCLEYLPEGDLLQFSEKFDIPLEQRIGYLVDIAAGLRYLHSKNIIHRDVKLTNILVFHDRKTCKICDFGTSKFTNQINTTLCGTPDYLPPETFHGEKTSNPKAIDVYSFGILMWEMLCDENPYEKLHKKYPGKPFQLLKIIHDKKHPKRPNLMHPKLNQYIGDNADNNEDSCLSNIIDLMETCWDADWSNRPTISDVLAELVSCANELQSEENDDEEEGTSDSEDDSKKTIDDDELKLFGSL